VQRDSAKDGSDDGDGSNFHGQQRKNDTHQSATDPDSRLYKKSYGKESKLTYLGHMLVENRNGLIAAAMVPHADGYAERDAALLMLEQKQRRRSRRITVGADKAYYRKDFVATVREMNVTQHVSRHEARRKKQPGQKNDAASWLCHQPESAMAGGKELWMAEADRTSQAGQISRTGESRLGLCLQLRRV
jgi:hypothetical protein